MKNIKRTACFLLLCLALTLMAACAALPEETTPPPEETGMTQQEKLFGSLARDNTLALVLYSPTEEQLDQVWTKVLMNDSGGIAHYDEVLVVPHYKDSEVSVDKVEWDEEGGSFSVTDNVGAITYNKDYEGQSRVGILVWSLIPEGFPRLQVTVTRVSTGETGTFLLGYDGKGDGMYFIYPDGENA